MLIPSRNRNEIKVWILRKGFSITEIACSVGTGRTNASKTIAGRRNNRAVLQWLLDNGCPAEYLALPEDMQNKGVK